MIPQDFGFRVKGYFYSFIIFILLSMVLYNQRLNLTNATSAYLQGTFLWGLMGKWQMTEWLCQIVWGPTALSGAFFYNSIRNGRRKRNAPNAFNENVVALNLRVDRLSQEIEALNENIFNFYKYFNVRLTDQGVLFQLDEIGKIKLRTTIQEADEIRKRLKEEQDRLDECKD